MNKLINFLVDKYYWNEKSSGIFGRIVRKLYVLKLNRSCSYIGNPHGFQGKPIFPHGIIGIFVSSETSVGKNCIIYQHVTIGSSYIPGSKHNGAPVIGDNCFIGAGATIVGGGRNRKQLLHWSWMRCCN